MDLMAKRRSLLMQPHGIDTTAKILQRDAILIYTYGGLYYRTIERENGGVTIKYSMDTPTKILYPAGIIPTSDSVIVTNPAAAVFIFDENEQPFSYVNETTQNGGYNRWAKDESGTLTEFSQKWTANQNYYFIQFTVDIRYLDRAYMYDKTTGQVWFAGKNTPYYGYKNISEAT